MPGRKRSGSEAGMTTRGANKANKTGSDSSKPSSKVKPASKAAPASKGKSAKRGPKAPATSSFKSRALPLHLNVTHTPPALADGAESATHADPGFLGALTLVPSSFSTGSYGWKGTKRFTVELEDQEGGEGKEKVHVMLTVNATVVGSKDAEGEDETEEKAAEEEPTAVEAEVEANE